MYNRSNNNDNYKNNEFKAIKPIIFSKKLNDNFKIIPFNNTINTLGPTKYFPPTNQE